jgi:hypothetical protein
MRASVRGNPTYTHTHTHTHPSRPPPSCAVLTLRIICLCVCARVYMSVCVRARVFVCKYWCWSGYIYGTLRDTCFEGKDPSGFAKLGMGCVSGGVAAFFSNPIEVTLVRAASLFNITRISDIPRTHIAVATQVRMQADGRLPPAQRRNYSNIFTGLYRTCSVWCDDG